MLYRRWKSGNITDEQSFPLILFLDVVSRCSVRAIYSCYIFCQNRLPSGMWFLPWHLMWASVDILFKGLPSIPFSARLAAPPLLSFLTLPSPPFLLFVMLSLSLRGHTVTLFTGSHAGVCVCVCVFTQISLPTILTKSESATALACE